MSLYNSSNQDYYGCNCNCNTVCAPDKIGYSSCLNSIRKTFVEIINAVKNENLLGFNVDVEITTKDGISNTINFSKLSVNSIKLTKTTLIADGIGISLCDISKINILSSSTTGSSFNSNLLNGIKNIATTCGITYEDYYSNCNSCGLNYNTDIKCAQGMQNYINENINTIDTISYTGNSTIVKNIDLVTDISTEEVLKSSDIDTTNVDVVNDATLATTKTSVVNAVTTNNVDVVSNIQTDTDTVLSGVTPATVDVSAPITATPTTVVTNIELAPDSNVVTSVGSTTKSVIDEVTSTTGTVVTGFTNSSNLTGVISNVDAIQNITPTSLSIPLLQATGTGQLVVTIAAGSIDGTNPVRDIPLNVTVGGSNVTYNGNTTKFVLDTATNVLGGGTRSPNISTIPITGTPVTDNFIKTVSSTNTPVVGSVTPTTVANRLVTNVTTGQINNVQTPTTKTVVESLTPVTKSIQTISNINSIKPDTLINTTTAEVLNDATLTVTEANVINTATLNNNSISVINDITTSPENIYIPERENISGRVFVAGDGIMGVNNANGDISVYSICDINTVNTMGTTNPSNPTN